MSATVVFLHAHPDDEAIFTGGTIRLLADAGHRVVLVVATAGEAGVLRPGVAAPDDLGRLRLDETAAAAELLGVHTVAALGYRDSGMDGSEPGGFAGVPVPRAAERLASVLDDLDVVADALVTYDPAGIYGHPDHVAAHLVGLAAAAELGTPLVYESTVDREYLHFVETHVVVEAGVPDRPPGLGLAATALGLSTVEIDTAVDVRPVLDAKRAAMAAHASQLPESSSPMRLAGAGFAEVYGVEWYRRRGPLGPIDDLPRI